MSTNLAAMRKALEPFAELAELYHPATFQAHEHPPVKYGPTIGDLWRARKALSSPAEGGRVEMVPNNSLGADDAEHAFFERPTAPVADSEIEAHKEYLRTNWPRPTASEPEDIAKMFASYDGQAVASEEVVERVARAIATVDSQGGMEPGASEVHYKELARAALSAAHLVAPGGVDLEIKPSSKSGDHGSSDSRPESEQ